MAQEKPREKAKTAAGKGSKHPASVKRAKPARGKSTGIAINDRLRDFCRALSGTTEDVKWGDDLVFSIGGKMYAGFDVEASEALGFKCDDDDFDRLTQIEGIIPAPYAARFGWVLVNRTDAVGERELKSLLQKAYSVVRAGLPKRVQRELDAVGT